MSFDSGGGPPSTTQPPLILIGHEPSSVRKMSMEGKSKLIPSEPQCSRQCSNPDSSHSVNGGTSKQVAEVMNGNEKVNYTAMEKFKKGAMFWSSMGKTAMQGYVGKNLGLCQYYHWDFITDHLILGAMPIKTKVGAGGDHLSKLERQLRNRGLQLGLVVSCVEQNEFEGYGVSPIDFVQPADWKERLGVDRVIHLVIPDYSAQLDMVQLLDVTEAIRTTIFDQGKAAYVHCKAGKGRSWVVAASFLTAHHHMSLPDAMVLLKERRPQVDPNKRQKALVREFCRYINEQRALLAPFHTAGDPSLVAPVSLGEEEELDSDLSSAWDSNSPTEGDDGSEMKYLQVLHQAMQLPTPLQRRLIEDLQQNILKDA